MDSLSSETAVIFGVRFVETVRYVFHKVDSLSSETAVILPFAVGSGMCISSRRFAMFVRNPCVLHDLRAILSTYRKIHFVETVCYVFSQPLCFTWLEGHFVNISQDKPIKTPWVFDTSMFRCSKNTTPPMQNDHFVDLGLFHDLPFTFAMSKKVSNRLESEWHFYNMWKVTPPKSYTYDNVIVYKSFRILHHSLFICILPCALTIHTRV